MKLTWAFSLNTVQYVNGVIYGATVLEGHILQVRMDGQAKIVWENDFSQQFTGSVFLYSIVVGNNIYFFPDASDYIAIYDTDTGDVEKILFEDKGEGEKIYPHIYQGEILMIGMDSGCIWKLSDTITPVHDVNVGVGALTKLRTRSEDRYILFGDNGLKQIAIYDCENNAWTIRETQDYIKSGFADEKYAWYPTEGHIHRYEMETGVDATVGKLSDVQVRILQLSEKQILICAEHGERRYLLEKETMELNAMKADDFKNSNQHIIIPLDKKFFLLADIEALDWMIWEWDRYAIWDVSDRTVEEIPMFNLEKKTGHMIKERYMKASWMASPEIVRFENAKEDLSFLIESLQANVFVTEKTNDGSDHKICK